jgi:hypothetical protein
MNKCSFVIATSYLYFLTEKWKKKYSEHSVSSYSLNLLKPTGYVMHQQFNIQQLYVLPTLYLCVLYLSENKQRLVSLTA